MKKITSAIKAGVKGFAKAFEPARYTAAGLKVCCTHCQNDVLQEQQALLNTMGATLMNLDWLDKSGTALICEKCGLIQWFRKKPERVQT